MQVEAIYDHGKLELAQPLKLKHQRIKVTVEIPDAEIEKNETPYLLPPEVVEMAKKMEEEMDRIRNQPLPDDDQIPPLTEKQLERIEAFELRDEVRSMR